MPSPTLRDLLARNQILLVPASYDMVSAKLIERAGFEAVYLSGYGHSASHLGLPDAGLISFSEMLDRVHHLVRSVTLPVLADGDTGFGGVIIFGARYKNMSGLELKPFKLRTRKFPRSAVTPQASASSMPQK